ncbi:glycogen debranching protein GlgX [Algibacillus agarilyticus]|uniref:glycogen debranching protein GlgX n=1 Tax=Algibacillus agarilyticus TaxID=2234133 RepID=UPI000DD0EBDA|nr:glycogen debranching protein GlgX [Algibacillus agarilyticus]
MINLSKQSKLFSVNKFDVYAGSAKKLGPTIVKGLGVNFAIYCPQAHKVELCLFDQQTEAQICAIELPAKKGRVWHGFVTNIVPGQLYGYRVYGDYNLDEGLVFDHEKLLIDPYAKALSRPLVWNERLYAGDSQQMISKSVVVDPEFDWQDAERPYVPDSDTVVYEMHVKGFTQMHPDVPDDIQGTYLGLAHPKVVKYLQELGVTTLQLMPVAAFMSEPRLTALGLTNYWGYNPINFFSPEPRYSSCGSNAVNEFKTMVRELHKAGIEVILDVVFNHSAEGGGDGPILSFRGLDNRNFYLFDADEHGQSIYRHYVNNTGCGNSINLDNPYVLQLVTQSLRYWVEEMHVDGFRFDLAVSLAREGNEFDNYSAFFKVLFQDPVLSQTKLIAEPWDIGYGGYRLGQFPENWHECNDKFRDTVKGFWKGDRGLIGDFATRFMGSRDVFHKDLRTINTSVNYIAYHDGFSLEDLVSYNHKHNEANCEQNRDGHGHNLSYNYGIEGPTTDKAINKLRQKQKRNLLATLFISQGTPHLLAGDEIGRTQLGNNNAYCQDNSISWLNWQLKSVHKKQLEFVRNLIKTRHSSPLLHSLSLKDDGYFGYNNTHEVNWFNANGELMSTEEWHNPDTQIIAVEMKAGSNKGDETLFVCINAATHDVNFTLPEKTKWSILFDTRFDNGKPRRLGGVTKKYAVESQSLVLLMRKW